MAKKFINTREVSEITGIKIPTLEAQRSQKRGIPYIKLGQSVRYDEDEVIEYMNSRRVDTNNKT